MVQQHFCVKDRTTIVLTPNSNTPVSMTTGLLHFVSLHVSEASKKVLKGVKRCKKVLKGATAPVSDIKSPMLSFVE